jgi:hypothetical protein
MYLVWYVLTGADAAPSPYGVEDEEAPSPPRPSMRALAGGERRQR